MTMLLQPGLKASEANSMSSSVRASTAENINAIFPIFRIRPTNGLSID